MKGQKKIMVKNKTRDSKRLFTADSFLSGEVQEKMIRSRLIWYWLAFVIATSLILMVSAIGSRGSFQAGEIASKTLIYEGSTFTYTSEVAYNKAVSEIESSANDVYLLDKTKIDDINGEIDAFLEAMNAIKSEPDYNSEEVVSQYQKLFGDGDDAAVYEESLNRVDMEAITSVADSLRAHIASTYANGVKDSEVAAYTEGLNEWIVNNFRKVEENIARAILSQITIEANYILDEEETAAVTAKRISEIQPEEVTVRSGEKIIDEGTEITPEQVEALQKAGMLSEGKGPFYFIGIFLYVFFLYVLLFTYCKRYFKSFIYERNGILMIGCVILAFLLLCQIIMVMVAQTSGTIHSVLGYLLPLPAVALVFSTLTDQRLAFIITTFSGLFMIILAQSQLSFILVAAIGALFTIYTVGRIRERFQLVSFGLYLGVVNMVSILVFGFIGEQTLRTILIGCVCGFFSGLLSALIALGTIPLLENTLKMATPMKLMELSSTGHPLIKRLMAEAPGTYYHSILVANLAEAGADAINADPLLTRVAAYYHDIGKLERPVYFTENQESGVNPHDNLTPAMSVLILVSHVKDGIEMARDYDLPKEVIDIISEHHGNGVIKYFYHKALENGDDVTKEDFSYPFPKPQSRESALVMIADTVQAAIQSMGPMTKGELTAKIHSLIGERLDDGQFEECDLTFRDLHVIQDAFVSVYDGITHHRIRYPELKALAKKSGLSEDMVRKKEDNGKEEKTEEENGGMSHED